MQYNDSAAYLQAIKKLIDNPDLAKSLGENGKRYVEEHLNAKVNTQQLIQIYKDVLKEKGIILQHLVA